jgi:hypothetical protein
VLQVLRTLCLVGFCVTLSVPAGAQVMSGRGGGPPGVMAEETAVTGTSVIKGRVVNAANGQPLRRAQVRLNAAERKARQALTIGTDAEGYFEATELPAGRYTITATRPGFIPRQHGQRHPDEPASPVELKDGQALTIDMALQRAGRVVGRVTDELGEPVATIPVFLLRQEFYQGRRRLVPAPLGGPPGSTDESGVFRISGVLPGTYYLQASSTETWTAEDDPQVTYSHTTTYYPGVSAEPSAHPIVVAPGQVVEGLDFSLVAARTATVSGTALGPDGLPLSGASVSLVREVHGPSAAGMQTLSQSPVAADGSWTLKNAPPGEFSVRVTGRRAGGGQETGQITITVNESDIEGVVVVSDPGAVVAGDVVTEDGSPLPPSLRVMTASEGSQGFATLIAPGADDGRVDEQGRFARRGASGPVLVHIIGLPGGWSIKGVEAGGEDFATTPLLLGRDERRTGVRIVLTDRFPNVSGTVTDDRGNPVEATVLLYPTNETQWFETQAARRVSRPDQSGVYRFSTVRPGEYLAVAVETLEPGASRDPEFLESLRGRATVVRLQEGENRTLNLKVQR